MKCVLQDHGSRILSFKQGPVGVPTLPGAAVGISWAGWSQQGRADISSLCRAVLLGHVWTASHPRPPERSGEPGGRQHGEGDLRGAGPGQATKVGAGRCVGWDITRGCSPSPAGDGEHQALAMGAECVCFGFWQRRLIKHRAVVGGLDVSRVRKGSLCSAGHGQLFIKSGRGPR